MDLKNIESFVQVAELGSFTKAASVLGYSQSTISFQIKQLEDSLGIPLFERISHRIRLTQKGSEILSLSHKLLALKVDIENAAGARRELGGCVRIAMADSLCHWLFWDNFESFHRQFPDIFLKIITFASTEEMFRMLNQNEVDLVYTLDKHIYDSKYTIAYEKQINAQFIAAAESPLCSQKSLTLSELLKQPFILTEHGISYRRLLEEALASRSLSVSPFLEIGDALLICRLVSQNMGLSFLPDYATERAVKNGEIERLSVPGFSVDIWIQLLYHHDKRCTPEMQCVIDYLRT